jgi:glycosyltransferase involved in cell wall biosynthesis
MHIVYICNEYPPTVAGGIGTAVAVLARGMLKAGHRVSVIGFYRRDTGVREQLECDQGVSVYRYVIGPGTAIGSVVSRWRLREIIKKIHLRTPIDVIEWPDFGGWYLAGIRGITDVVKVHGGYVSHRVHGLVPRKPIREYLELRTLRVIKNWVGVSQWFNNEWRELTGSTPQREAIVYNPVDTEVFIPSPRRNPRVIVYSGGLTKRKGVQVLAEAASLFLPDNPDCKLLMIGYEADLSKEEVMQLAGKGAPQIEFVPFMPQERLAEMLASSGIFLMPSIYESCGNGWIEAMSCGLPVIGSTWSCGPEIVADGVTGLLANPGDPADVARKVTRLLRSPDMASQLGVAGRRRVLERFSVEIAVRTSERFYAECRSSMAAMRA